jgi:glycosyltransferase involved in cell wall biosynthesis
MDFSFIIPVFNRPDEIDELLLSLSEQHYSKPFEIVIIEDGSTIPCNDIIEKYTDLLTISYYKKQNSGPGDSRNFGMNVAKGDYFILLDSDCLLPKDYLQKVESSLEHEFVDCFGGPDAALASFSDIQKAINFSMTSFLTTGGIRGGSEKIDKFQPRSFNMGLSRIAFKKSNGFGNIHPGEDPDLSIRLWQLGFKTRLIKDAFVFHKRRISWNKFYTQVNKFGKARPILNAWYPTYSKFTFWVPTLFVMGFYVSFLVTLIGFYYLLFCYFFYFLLLFATAFFKTKRFKLAILAVIAAMIQFYGYGTGFAVYFLRITILNQKPETAFPELFFKK